MKRFIAIFMTLCLVLGIASINVWAAEDATWEEETPMGKEMSSGCSCVVGDKIYVIGGYDTLGMRNTVEIYDTKNHTWTMGKSMPTPRGNLTSSVIGDKIYVIGGVSSSDKVGTVEIYDTQTNTWSTGKSMPTARYFLASSVVRDKIYVIGGQSIKGVNTVEIYNPQTDTWTTGKSMPTARYGLTSSVVGDKIYAIGGNITSAVVNTVEIYDPQTDTWTTGKSMPTARAHLTCSVVGDKIYAIGGSTGSVVNKVEIYDIQTNTWTMGKSLSATRAYLTSQVVGDKIYAIGGHSGYKPLRTMESLQVGDLPDGSTTKLSVLLNVGENIQLSTSFDLDNNKTFTWSSTNEAVATVDANGKVTAVAEGTTDIYAQNADGTFKEYIPVKVVKGVADELRLAVHLKTAETANLYLTDDPSKVTWSSMDNSIATVSADGKVTGVKKGLAIIKGELEGKSYQIYVRVNG